MILVRSLATDGKNKCGPQSIRQNVTKHRCGCDCVTWINWFWS